MPPRPGFFESCMSPCDLMAVGGERVEFSLLFAGEVPACVKPVRVARGQVQALGAVGLRQFARALGRAHMFGRRDGAEGVALARTVGGRRGRLVALEQNRRHGRDSGLGGGFLFRRDGGFGVGIGRCFCGFFR